MHINKAYFVHMQKHLSVQFSSYHISYFLPWSKSGARARMLDSVFSMQFLSATFNASTACFFFLLRCLFLSLLHTVDANKSLACELSFLKEKKRSWDNNVEAKKKKLKTVRRLNENRNKRKKR